jgi:Double zinc ribbon
VDDLTAAPCPVCGKLQPDAKRFCVDCGADRTITGEAPVVIGPETASRTGIAVVCASCGDANDGRRFCRNCGAERTTPAPSAGASPGARMCATCGVATEGEHFCRVCGTQRGLPAVAAPVAGSPAPQRGRGRKRVIAFSILGLAIVAAAAIAVVELTGSKSSPAAAPARKHPTATTPLPATTSQAPTTTAQQPASTPSTTSTTTTSQPTTQTTATTGGTGAVTLVALRSIGIAALHTVDAEDHCIGPGPRAGKPHVTIRLGGVFRENVAGSSRRAPILICGKSGDPSYATGTYRFGGPALGTHMRLGVLQMRFGIDESGGQSQPAASVGLSVKYYGRTVCTSSFASWLSPQTFRCNLAQVDEPADTSQLSIFQLVRGAAPPDVWAGLMSPRVELLGPSKP